MRTQGCPYPFLLRPFGIRLRPICCAAIALAVATETHASLIPIVFVDTPTQLAILWDWDEFSGAGSHGAGLSVACSNEEIPADSGRARSSVEHSVESPHISFASGRHPENGECRKGSVVNEPIRRPPHWAGR